MELTVLDLVATQLGASSSTAATTKSAKHEDEGQPLTLAGAFPEPGRKRGVGLAGRCLGHEKAGESSDKVRLGRTYGSI
jgi:hypothetical protein